MATTMYPEGRPRRLSEALRALRAGPTILDRATGRDNNFNLLRMIAAAAVLVSHSAPIALGPGAVQPLEATFGFTLGHAAVAWFFILSGFLIAQSFERRRSFVDFVVARALRLVPGLLVVLLLTAFVLGPLATALHLADYYSASETYTYVVRNLTLLHLQYPLPGVFEGNPYGPAINGSLWTLVHEVACYATLALVGVIGLFGSRRVALVCLFAYFALYVLAELFQPALPARLVSFQTLSLPFATGTAFYLLRRSIVLSLFGAIGAAGVIAAAAHTDSFELFCVGSAYLLFYAGYAVSGPVRKYNRLGDYSYGTYIYAFPVQQSLMVVFGTMTVTQNILLALPITVLFAAASWHLVEERSLRQRRWLANKGQRLIGAPAVASPSR